MTSTRINSDYGVEFGVADQFEPPAAIRITHRNIDRHKLSLRLIALMLGLPIGQGHNIIRVSHAEYVVIVLNSDKLID